MHQRDWLKDCHHLRAAESTVSHKTMHAHRC